MPDNVQAVLAGITYTFKTTESGGIQIPHHIAERDPADPMLGLVGETQLTPSAYTLQARLKNIEGYTDSLEGDIALIRQALTAVAPWKTTSAYNPTNITSNTTTFVKIGAGVIDGIAINKPGTSEILAIYDSLAASGTLLGTIAVLATDTYRKFPAIFGTGLTIVSSGSAAGDFTVFAL